MRTSLVHIWRTPLARKMSALFWTGVLQIRTRDVRIWRTPLVRTLQTNWFVQGGHFASSALFSAKNFGFFEIYGVSARTRGEGGWASANILLTRGVNFSRFCADVFYGRPLRENLSFFTLLKALVKAVRALVLLAYFECIHCNCFLTVSQCRRSWGCSRIT